ncbi:MAG: hypothetical protein V3U02_04400 [Calditrichia bacterium]
MDDQKTTEMVKNGLKEIGDSGLVDIYEVEGSFYAKHPNWRKFQILRNDRYQKSEFPQPPKTTKKQVLEKNDNQMATVGIPSGNQVATNGKPTGTNRPPNLTKLNLTKLNLTEPSGGEKSPTAYGDTNINSFYEIIKTETGRPATSGQQARRYAYNFLRKLKKEYPNFDPLDGARAIIRAALSFDNPWHATKCHDPQHLFYKWQEIVALVEFKKSTKSVQEDKRTEEQKRSDKHLAWMKEETK